MGTADRVKVGDGARVAEGNAAVFTGGGVVSVGLAGAGVGLQAERNALKLRIIRAKKVCGALKISGW